MICCDTKHVYEPLIENCNGNTQKISPFDTLRINGQEIPIPILQEDMTIYLSPGGNDNDPGKEDTPFKTLHRAQEEVLKFIPGNQIITISLARGIYVHNAGFKPSWLYGDKVNIVGQKENPGSCAISNIDLSHSTDANFPNLQYFDCDINLSGASNVSIGFFVQVNTTSGGTYGPALLGLHKIIAWDSSTNLATIRIWQRVGTAEIPSGSITVTGAWVMQTVIAFDESVADHGIEMIGTHSGNWQNIIIEGNQNGFDTYRGIRARVGGLFNTTGLVGLHNWDVGCECFNGSFVELSTGMISKMYTLGISVQDAGVRFAFGAYASGCGVFFAMVQASGNLTAFDSFIIASSKNYAIWTAKLGHVDVENADFYYEDAVFPTTACLRAEKFSEIVATGATFTGFTTSKSTATQGIIEPP